ncbi:MAG: sulfatase-like hydrolase/transferase [Armatimonadota bacterium]|nr:sulfatase-like hydrolase/transferase [Armatimonadota bacterium]
MSPPNILLVFSDQEQSLSRSPLLSLPHRQRLMERGVTFERCYCTTPQCSASRASIMTGRYPQEVGVVTNIGAVGGRPLSPQVPTLGNVFREASYETQYMGKWHLGNEGGVLDDFGFPGRIRARGEELAERAAGWLASPPPEPWLLVVSFVNPHDVYSMPPEHPVRPGLSLPDSFGDDLHAKPPPQLRFLQHDQGVAVHGFEEEDWLRYISWYYDLIERVDGHLGAILDALESSGQDGNTLVAYTSDHGDMAGGHGMPFKGPFMYEELLRVPLVVRWPDGAGAGETRDTLAGLVDLAPTFAAAAGIDWPAEPPGRNLRAIAEDASAPWRDRIFAQYHSKQRWSNPIRTVRTRRWKYNHYLEDRDELYDLQEDPSEMRNEIHTPEHQELIGKLRACLDEWRRETGDPLRAADS